MTEGPYIIIPPGGPAGPFYGLMNARGNIVATQIAGEENTKFLASSWEMWQLLIAIWESKAAQMAMPYETLKKFDKFMLGEED
jgi:hypothetical protein